jgi:hypothetical protein
MVCHIPTRRCDYKGLWLSKAPHSCGRKHMRCLWISVMGASFFLTGCASQQLKLTTSSLIPTLRSIERDQVLDNLGRFLADPTAVPVEVAISGGSAQIANQVQPSIVFPFHGWMGNQASLQLQGQLTVNWSLAPVNNGEDLGRLRALYRYGTGAITDFQDFKNEYPPVREKDGGGNPRDTAVKTIPYFDPSNSSSIPPRFAYSSKPAAPTAVDCGVHQGQRVWITSEAELDKFMLWTFVATPNTGGGGGGAGKPGALLLNAIQ